MLDAVQLIWAPWKLPTAAVRIVSVGRSVVAGQIGWGLLFAAGMTSFLAHDGNASFWDEGDLLRRVIGNGKPPHGSTPGGSAASGCSTRAARPTRWSAPRCAPGWPRRCSPRG